ncbi:trypsin-like serine protease [Paeniglutamicibacter gangotriensis]|uniref:Trypsin-like serine protease n=1 Tax=Paeniglutamicibacter gangotriensis TaxID=254787 RepID=A0A5B0EC68_9MICC|nr:trypsin-like serine protease [Paeniglutamicibacter gangotriensis]KAA0975805.1 trypsin-like serine protease [Paeniglutamicibacter gangotriensis]
MSPPHTSGGLFHALAGAPKSTSARQTDAKVLEAPKPKANPANVDALLDAYVESVDPKAVAQLQAVMKDSSGSFIIRTGGDARTESKSSSPSSKASSLRVGGKMTPNEFVDQFTEVSIEVADGPAKKAAANDVLGGMVYGVQTSPGNYSVCSIGFNGFNAAGDDAAISAGHCSKDGSVKDVKILEHSAPEVFDGEGPDLGTFGFSQFGGPGNSPVTGLDDAQTIDDLGNVGTDIAVIDRINKDLDLKALVSDWKTPDIRDSSVKVAGVASAVIGSNVCKSGRTTGWTCGKIDEVGIFLVGGGIGPDDGRGVHGFTMPNAGYKKANEGDSGGSVISGGTAVGVTSAIAEVPVTDDEGNVVRDESDEVVTVGRAYFTDIKDGLKHTDGYSIAVFLNAPAVATPAQGSDIAAGQTLNGTFSGAPSGSTVKIKSAGPKDISAKVANGKFQLQGTCLLWHVRLHPADGQRI